MTNDIEEQAALSRRSLLTRSAAGLVTVVGMAPFLFSNSEQVFASPLRSLSGLNHQPVLGHDLSTLQQLEDVGQKFSDKGHVRPVERIVAEYGATYVRLRLWVNPPAPYNDLPHILSMAKRIKAAGLKLLLDFHYSDFWADPGTQTTPLAWQDQDVPTLAKTVYSYTRDVVERLARQHTPVEMVQIGNEITGGMLWPQGKLYVDGTQRWAEFTTLLNAGINGARDGGASTGKKPRIMVHIDRGGDNGGCRWFYDNILQWNVTFDVIGLSYYPWWHGPLSDLQANLNDLAVRYHKDIVAVETAYPWTLTEGDSEPNIVTDQTILPADYPPTPAGQLAYIHALLSIVDQVPEQRGKGVVYWESAWIPGVGWKPGAGDGWDNMTLFDRDGRALSSIKCFVRR